MIQMYLLYLFIFIVYFRKEGERKMGRKRKAYFNNAQKEKKQKLKFGNLIKLSPGMKGYLITYNCKFTFCLNECKKLLQQFSLPNESELVIH